jgi:hypothetical protein
MSCVHCATVARSCCFTILESVCRSAGIRCIHCLALVMCNKARFYLRSAMLEWNWLRLTEGLCLFLYHFAVRAVEGEIGG